MNLGEFNIERSMHMVWMALLIFNLIIVLIVCVLSQIDSKLLNMQEFYYIEVLVPLGLILMPLPIF